MENKMGRPFWYLKKKIKKTEQLKCIVCGGNVYKGKYCNECRDNKITHKYK